MRQSGLIIRSRSRFRRYIATLSCLEAASFAWRLVVVGSLITATQKAQKIAAAFPPEPPSRPAAVPFPPAVGWPIVFAEVVPRHNLGSHGISRLQPAVDGGFELWGRGLCVTPEFRERRQSTGQPSLQYSPERYEYLPSRSHVLMLSCDGEAREGAQSRPPHPVEDFKRAGRGTITNDQAVVCLTSVRL